MMRPSIDVILSNQKYFRYHLIWQKTMAVGFLDANKKPLRSHEFVLVFAKTLKNTVYNPQKTKGTAYIRRCQSEKTFHYSNIKERIATVNKGDRFPTDVLKFKNGKGGQNNYHPTEKPLDLIKYLVKTYSNENQLILDPFAGSGTLALACLETNRRYICIEKDDEYFETMTNRISRWHNDKLNSTGTHELPHEIERIKNDKKGQLNLF